MRYQVTNLHHSFLAGKQTEPERLHTCSRLNLENAVSILLFTNYAQWDAFMSPCIRAQWFCEMFAYP